MFSDFHTHLAPVSNNVEALISTDKANHINIAANPVSRQYLPWNGDSMPEVGELAGFNAAGEAGLDRSKNMPVNRQIEYFHNFLEVAEAAGKPVVLHCVKMYPELNGCLKGFRNNVMLHRFSGSFEEMLRQLNLGRFVSFSLKELTFRQELLSKFPVAMLNRLGLESDANYQEPGPDYQLLYQSAAKILKIDFDDLKSLTANNLKVFLNVE